MARLAHRLADRRFQLGRYALVRVEAQHPIVARFRDREILLRAVSEPGLSQHPGAGAVSDFYGIIAAAGIDDEALRREARGAKAVGDLASGVVRDDENARRKSSRVG